MTAQEIIDLTKARDPNFYTKGDSFSLNWLNIIGESLKEALEKHMPDSYTKDHTITVVSGTSAYDLPDDFGNMNSLSCGLFEFDSNGVKTKEYRETERGSGDEGYWFDLLKINLTPKPTTGNTLKLVYNDAYTDLIAMSGLITLPRPSNIWKDFYVQMLGEFSAIDNDDENVLIMKQQMRLSAYNEAVKRMEVKKKRVLRFTLP